MSTLMAYAYLGIVMQTSPVFLKQITIDDYV